MSDRRPVLLVALGNPLAGDDGVACHLARRLREDPRLPGHVELLDGGTDLLRLEDDLEDRERVILLDALLEEGEPGRLLRFDGELHELDDRGAGVHALPPVAALRLLRSLFPTLRRTPVTFLGVTVTGVQLAPSLSPALQARLEGLVEEVLGVVGEATEPASKRRR